MKKAAPTLAFVLLLAASLPASAEIYKCRLANGKTEISNRPCPTGSGTLTVRPDEAVPEASRRQAERDVERMRDYVDKREAAQRADEAAARQEQAAASQRQQSAARAPRNYASPEECRRDVDQMALEANQRAQMEAECRAIVRPQTVYVPVVVPVYPQRTYNHPPPTPAAKPAPPSAPKISVMPGQKN